MKKVLLLIKFFHMKIVFLQAFIKLPIQPTRLIKKMTKRLAAEALILLPPQKKLRQSIPNLKELAFNAVQDNLGLHADKIHKLDNGSVRRLLIVRIYGLFPFINNLTNFSLFFTPELQRHHPNQDGKEFSKKPAHRRPVARTV